MKPYSFARRSIAPLLACAALFVACGGNGKGTPSTPSTPVPTPTPAPTPTPTPTPTPGAGFACGATTVTSGDVPCRSSGATFDREVQSSLDQLQAEHPEYFDFGDQRGGPRVKSQGRYIVGMLQNLQGRGLCAGWDGEELQVKKDNTFNDQFDILLASGHVRQGATSYRTTCEPAAFPTPAPPLAPVPGCSLPPSREVACGDEDSVYGGEVESAIGQLQVERPDVFSGENVRDERAYYDGLLSILKSRGYCALYDGEEIAVKKENGFSEQHDVLLASGRIRHQGYTVTCVPAAF